MRSRGETLVKMANQIGAYVTSQHGTDLDAAAQALAAHLKSFWAPPMRLALIDLLKQPEGGAMLPVVTRALSQHHAVLTNPVDRMSGPSGELFPSGGGDAG